MTENSRKSLVAAGYNQIADAYALRFGNSAVRDAKLAEFIVSLSIGGRVLDLGCGDDLVLHGCSVVGVDGSQAQIERARKNVPKAQFMLADMTSVQFAPMAFDAVVAFYSITHVPKAEHELVISNVAAWLHPGGVFVASFGVEEGDWTGDWLGVPMFFSHSAPEAAKAMVRKAGLNLTQTEVKKQDNEDASFLWISARKN
jgi:SAM-dependent methyltransferase